jgi:hypothetical protein
MTDLVEQFHQCDWCGYSVKNIGPAITGFMYQVYDVYLCNNPKCGHEMEIVPLKYDPNHYFDMPWESDEG